jgi:hypothetical protein
MDEYLISYAGSTVSIHFDSGGAFDFLTMLFGDIPCSIPLEEVPVLVLGQHDTDGGNYILTFGMTTLFHGRLGVRCAAILYDAVIYHLLNNADGGVALHAGAVAWRDRVMLLPGQSGAGKSTLTAWLTAQGSSYLTDELIFIPEHVPGQIQFFSRPICLKSAALPLIKGMLDKEHLPDIVEDCHGAIVPHRLLNAHFSAIHSMPELMLLPSYEPGSSPTIEKISAARLCMSLVSCHVNARNLENHGFAQIVRLARVIPAYQIRYSGFQGLGDALNDVLDEVKRS